MVPGQGKKGNLHTKVLYIREKKKSIIFQIKTIIISFCNLKNHIGRKVCHVSYIVKGKCNYIVCTLLL